ncbi:uncharacterized protein LOC129251200 [Anastrepha obliqua]|uniref:uncharacterized protein LOC129251200 n=1 Tax=Anastrepha obliqua TaxID=95512 RepID=UPI0024092370|nr:uncharacterized protein LOC129251200 [Anastrepha obliqua]
MNEEQIRLLLEEENWTSDYEDENDSDVEHFVAGDVESYDTEQEDDEEYDEELNEIDDREFYLGKDGHTRWNNDAPSNRWSDSTTNNSSSIKQQHRSCNNQAIKTAARELRVTNNSSSIKQQHRSCNNQAIKTAARELRVTNFIKKFFLVLVESFSTCEYFILQQIILNNNNQNQVSETRESDCVENFS